MFRLVILLSDSPSQILACVLRTEHWQQLWGNERTGSKAEGSTNRLGYCRQNLPRHMGLLTQSFCCCWELSIFFLRSVFGDRNLLCPFLPSFPLCSGCGRNGCRASCNVFLSAEHQIKDTGTREFSSRFFRHGWLWRHEWWKIPREADIYHQHKKYARGGMGEAARWAPSAWQYVLFSPCACAILPIVAWVAYKGRKKKNKITTRIKLGWVLLSGWTTVLFSLLFPLTALLWGCRTCTGAKAAGNPALRASLVGGRSEMSEPDRGKLQAFVVQIDLASAGQARVRLPQVIPRTRCL